MNTKTKVWFIIATSLTLLGIVIFTIVMSVNNWDFNKLSTTKYQTNEYVIIDDFSNIEINSKTADITILPSQDGDNKVICFEDEKQSHVVNVSGDKLSIDYSDNRKWYQYINFNFNSPKITIYLNQTAYNSLVIKENTGDVTVNKDFNFNDIDIKVSTGDVKFLASVQNLIKIKTSTGNILLDSVTAGDIDLTVTTGKVNLSSVNSLNSIKINTNTGKVKVDGATCKKLISNGDTGDITIKNVIATDIFEIERDTGDVIFESSDAGEIYVETDTGNVKGTLLSNKIFITNTNTGRVSTPQTTSGGICKIETDTGDIIISIV